MCIITCRFSQQCEKVLCAILQRHNKLQQVIPLNNVQCSTFRQWFTGCPGAPSSHYQYQGTCLQAIGWAIAHYLQGFCLFQNPEQLHGRQFLFSLDGIDSEIFEVIGYSQRWDKTLTFDLTFDGSCEYLVPVNAGELMRILKNSLY